MATKDALFKVVALGEVPQELLDKFSRNFQAAANQAKLGIAEVGGTEDKRQTNIANPAIDNSTGPNSVGLSGPFSGDTVADVDLKRAAKLRQRIQKWTRKTLAFWNDPTRVSQAATAALEEIKAFSERSLRIFGIKGQARLNGAVQAAAWFAAGNSKYRTRAQGNAEVIRDQPLFGSCIDPLRRNAWVGAIVGVAGGFAHDLTIFQEANLSLTAITAYLAGKNAILDSIFAGYLDAGYTGTFHVETDAQGMNFHVVCTDGATV